MLFFLIKIFIAQEVVVLKWHFRNAFTSTAVATKLDTAKYSLKPLLPKKYTRNICWRTYLSVWVHNTHPYTINFIQKLDQITKIGC